MCYAMTRPGAQPTAPRPSLGDHAGSMGLAYGIAAALFKRATTGEPSVVETSLLATAVWMLSADVTYSQAPGYQVHGIGATRAPLKYAYTTRDGRLIQLMLLDPRPHWAPLCKMLGLEELIEDARFVDNEARIKNAESLIEIIQRRIGERSWAEWAPFFEVWDAPWELIRTIDDVRSDPQVLANDMIVPLQQGAGHINVVASPVAFDGLPAPTKLNRSPQLGEHSQELLAGLGYSEEAIAGLRQRGITQ
jgi:crotonobetainyl-CoA:carnitine CoA-transferase CaiB-like acyl-CoA transferase